MKITNFHTNGDGDIVFESTRLSEDKKEKDKLIYDRIKWLTWITINPIDNSIIKTECECPSYKFNKGYCKHIKDEIKELVKAGIKVKKNE